MTPLERLDFAYHAAHRLLDAGVRVLSLDAVQESDRPSAVLLGDGLSALVSAAVVLGLDEAEARARLALDDYGETRHGQIDVAGVRLLANQRIDGRSYADAYLDSTRADGDGEGRTA